MKITKAFTTLTLFGLTLLSGCNANHFSNWKEDGAIKTIKDYIDDVTNKDSKNFIPVEDRISTWDIDGTGIVERNLDNNDLLPQDQVYEYVYEKYRKSDLTIKAAYEAFNAARSEYWKDEENVVNKALFRVSQGIYYDALVGGLTPYQATRYFEEAVANGSYTSKKKLNDIAYKPMKEVYSYLKQHDFQVYFVSGTFRYVLQPLANANFGDVDFAHCIGTDFDTEYSSESGQAKVVFTSATDICLNDVKVNKIVTEIGKTPVIAFGNSTGDLEMLQYTISACKYKSLGVCINHDDNVREYKYNFDKVHDMCTSIGALEVSMKNDFLNVF